MEALPPYERFVSLAAVLMTVYLVLFRMQAMIVWKGRLRGRTLPPGPKPLPIIGNLLHMPRLKQWHGFREMCAVYGDLVHLDIVGKSILVIGSTRAASELLEKRSANTSDRPVSHVLPLIGNDIAFSGMQYGRPWKDRRRAFWQTCQPSVVATYRETECKVVRNFLRMCLGSPGQVERHLRYTISAMNLRIMYGLEAEEESHANLLAKLDEGLSCTTDFTANPHPVELLPILRYFPSWFPGGRFKQEFAKCKAAVLYSRDVAYAKMQAKFAEGHLQACALGALLSKLEDAPGTMAEKAYQRDVIRDAGIVALEAGTDTLASTLLGAFLALSLYPDVQAKAHEELDRVVGPHRLPDWADRDELVYINALIKEALRWHVVLPLGLPHATIEDEELDGYFIPAGTTLICNTWAILHDPAVYPNPEDFRPERFIRDGKLDETVLDPSAYAFGYGRRVCPGRYFANDALFMAAASVIHTFRFSPPLDEKGRQIKVELQQTRGFISYPEDRRFAMEPRSAEAVALISSI
ncbi:cytochrome P450 [Trametes polyzona]|nr:cytochrome P450 [Trametes polyzona]